MARSPHGGKVATTAAGHLELLATRDGSFHVWLLDGSLNVRSVDGATGKGPRIETGHAQVSVKVTAAGRSEEATFTLDFENHGGVKKHEGGHGH